MNPWAFLLLVLTLIIIVAAVKGKQDNLVAAMLGRKYGSSNFQ